MDDREAGSYSTPPQNAPGDDEARVAGERMARGLPTLVGAILAGAILVGLVALVLVYAF